MSRRRPEFTQTPPLPELRTSKHVSGKEFHPKNRAQQDYLNMIENNTITFGLGVAGTGKTFVAAMAAANAYRSGKIEKIIITRPVVEAGEELGFLPGDLNEKYAPYVQPFLEALEKIMGSGNVSALVNNKRIVFLPLAYMRGHSWENTFVVLDEAQNITKSQMKLFLTRIGKNTKVVVDGDITQKDINVNGLEDAVERLARVPSVAVQVFEVSDIVRSGIVKHIITAYDDRYVPDDADEGLMRFMSEE